MEPRTKSQHLAKREFWQHQISKWKASGLKLLTYDQFIKDEDFQEEFKELLQEEGVPDCSMEENHALVAEMIIPRWGEPSAW